MSKINAVSSQKRGREAQSSSLASKWPLLKHPRGINFVLYSVTSIAPHICRHSRVDIGKRQKLSRLLLSPLITIPTPFCSFERLVPCCHYAVETSSPRIMNRLTRSCPALPLGNTDVPAFVLPGLLTASIFTIHFWTANRGLEHQLLFQQEQRWMARNIPEEICRCTMFILPFWTSFFVASYCNTCLCWRSVLFVLRPLPPSIDRGMFIGGFIFTAFWMATSLLLRDRNRAYRSPMRTFKVEGWFCARMVAWANLVMMALWVAVELYAFSQ
jgi:hypothetical protein